MIHHVFSGKKTHILISFLIVFANQIRHKYVDCHGRLMEPPARNSMWRFGYPNPVDYNDNELYCGGYSVQWFQNDGKCGICGDPYHFKQPRPHETGGEFGRGIITRHYFSGQIIDIIVELTTNHKGRFELRLCPNNNPKREANQSCFDRHLLYVETDRDTREAQFTIPENSSKKEIFHYAVRLPPYLTCSQCVLQWTYYTGNMWGTCPNGTEGLGCGHSETFRNCADVRIVSSASGLPPQFVNSISHTALSREYTSKAGPQISYSTVVKWQTVYGIIFFLLCNIYLFLLVIGLSNAFDSIDSTLFVHYYFALRMIWRFLYWRGSQVCVATKNYRILPGMDKWCQSNCVNFPSVCPEDFCVCPDTCYGIGNITNVPGADEYCQDKCLVYGAKCPQERCVCY